MLVLCKCQGQDEKVFILMFGEGMIEYQVITGSNMSCECSTTLLKGSAKKDLWINSTTGKSLGSMWNKTIWDVI